MERERKVFSHAGKDGTVDMGIDLDTITGPVNPKKILEDIKYLKKAKRKPKGVSRN